MVEAAILDGDLVVVKPTPDAKNGEIVVAMLDGEATVKRFYRESSRIRLQPENRCYDANLRGRCYNRRPSRSRHHENSSEPRRLIDAILEHANCSPEVAHAARAAASMLAPRDTALRARIRMRVVGAFLKEGIAESDLAGTLGYGYDDAARAALRIAACSHFSRRTRACAFEFRKRDACNSHNARGLHGSR